MGFVFHRKYMIVIRDLPVLNRLATVKQSVLPDEPVGRIEVNIPRTNRITGRPTGDGAKPLPEALNSPPLPGDDPAGLYPAEASYPSSLSLPSALGLPEGTSSEELLYTSADLFRDFPTDDVCLEYIKEQLWPQGMVHCQKCGVTRKHYRVSGRKAYACNHCGNHIYPLAGTIFAKSTTPLRTWLYILYLLLSTGGRISARQIQRETGVTYKTAWRSRGQILDLLFQETPERGDKKRKIERGLMQEEPSPKLEQDA